MKKRLLSIAFVLCMMFAVLPMAVCAEGTTLQGSGTESDPWILTQENIESYKSQVVGIDYYVLPNGNYKLGNDDIEIGIALYLNSDVTLDLNGKKLKWNSASGYLAPVYVAPGGLTINDSSAGGGEIVSDGPSIHLQGTAALTLNGGVVNTITVSQRTHTITLNGGTVNGGISGTSEWVNGNLMGTVLNANGGTVNGFVNCKEIKKDAGSTGTVFNGFVNVTVINADGGFCKVDFMKGDNDRQGTKVVSSGSKVTAPEAPTKTDYKFLGWYEKDQEGNFKEHPLSFDTLISENITLYARWKDDKAPVISGFNKEDKTYCSSVSFTVTDNEEVASVGYYYPTDSNTVYTLTPDTDNTYTITANETTGDHKDITIIAKDKAGNEAKVENITVNNGHTYEWQTDEENGQYWQKCKFCDDETVKKDIPEITINGADKVCATQDYEFTFTVPEGSTNVTYGFEFAEKGDNGYIPNLDNGIYSATILSDVLKDDTSFKLLIEAMTADGYIISASKDVQIMAEHTGGTADCTHKAKCEVCGEEYGEVDAANHTTFIHTEAKAATVTETGNTEYWYCEGCGKYFSDKDGKNVIDLKDTVIGKLPPEIIDGKEQSFTAGEARELTFRSNAAYSDFIRVEIDGQTVDGKNYTVKEGSTVVTLNADYTATLSAGRHTLSIVSENGTATTTFTVYAKAGKIITSPITGDNSYVTLMLALLLVSGGALTGIIVYSKKKKHLVK